MIFATRPPCQIRLPRAQAGLTLIELMVAMVISLVIVLAATAALLISRQGFTSVDAASQLRDSARFAQDVLQRLGVQAVKLKSVRQVRDGLWDRLLTTYRNASQNCDGEPFCPRVRSVADLRQLAAAFTGEISPAHAAWASKSQVFHEQALNEQLRVAVLVP